MLGRALAAHQSLPFVDLDEMIEFSIGRSIEDFVEEHGWQVFREIEQRVAHDVSRNFLGVVATGGGTIENSKNLQNLKKGGYFVFLNPSFMEVKKYLLKDTTRPRINPDIPHAQEINEMWDQRKGIYGAVADLEVCPEYNGESLQEAQKIWEILPAMQRLAGLKEKKCIIITDGESPVLSHLMTLSQSGRFPNTQWSGISLKAGLGTVLAEKNEATWQDLPFESENVEDWNQQLIEQIRAEKPAGILLLTEKAPEFTEAYKEQFGETTYRCFATLDPRNSKEMSLSEEVAYYEDLIQSEETYAGCSVQRLVFPPETTGQVVQRKIPIESYDNAASVQSKMQCQKALAWAELLEKI